MIVNYLIIAASKPKRRTGCKVTFISRRDHRHKRPRMYEVYARVHLDQTFMTVALGVVYAACFLIIPRRKNSGHH